jgi:hypothetical protein
MQLCIKGAAHAAIKRRLRSLVYTDDVFDHSDNVWRGLLVALISLALLMGPAVHAEPDANAATHFGDGSPGAQSHGGGPASDEVNDLEAPHALDGELGHPLTHACDACSHAAGTLPDEPAQAAAAPLAGPPLTTAAAYLSVVGSPRLEPPIR